MKIVGGFKKICGLKNIPKIHLEQYTSEKMKENSKQGELRCGQV